MAEPALTPARPAPRITRKASLSWRSPALRGRLYQALLLLAVAVLGWLLLSNTLENMRLRGIRSGFDFLLDPAGFDIGESWLHYESNQPYWRAFLVGLLNTLRVALAGIVLATLLGTLLGIGRFSRNPLLRGLCSAYVECFRNIPLLLQLLMWYLLLTEYLPLPAEALRLGDWFFLSKSGLSFPAPTWNGGFAWEVPRLGEFQVEGGGVLTPEFLALLLGLVFYTAAFIAEIVRAGIASVPRAQHEAAASLGLSRWRTMRLVTLPQAMRLVVPPMTNQYLNLTKNSSLAVAVGYPELVSIANTSLNQTGRAVECITIIMAVYLCTSLATAGLMNAFNRRMRLRER
ncbi:MAG: transporter permease subunit [Ramlibacter sp.]|jgi:general L-amino acid transport system permease protein|nr:transporter permease subunit [Ramlibacter sp.]